MTHGKKRSEMRVLTIYVKALRKYEFCGEKYFKR